MDEPTPQAPPAAVPHARAFPWFAYTLLGLLSICVVLAGLGLMFFFNDPPDPGTVTEVRISGKPGIDLSKLEEILDTPDYYLEVWSPSGHVRTTTFKDTRVGNGLSFKLPVPLRLADITEFKVWDENVRKDELVDRVDRPSRETDGEKFHFAATGFVPPPSRDWKIGLGLSVAGGIALLLTIVKFIRAQVV